ncbi:hypothetical protein QVD17_28978 [Tagetes erecta]|uniref:PB1 domain-containing protein n=1 Tax=Tagetes erecta TaxID=13708 RepID=A0AAD8KB86_TARER|nr:hypothetical protein QVD17_28978 [Tagetes erecta]
MDSIHGVSGSFQIASKRTHSPFPATKIETFTPCSWSSSSGHSLSGDGVLKRTKSDAELYALNDKNQEPNIIVRSHSHKSLIKPKTCHDKHPRKPHVQREDNLWSVKVSFGEEKTRFRMQKDWGYSDLLQEIARRFCLNDSSGYQLKYLDDDDEWVLLTCDADVEECIDVYQSFRKNGTIRLTLHEPKIYVGVGSSLGSNVPFVR